MDNGEEIPGLNEEWNFLGASIQEWIAGVAMFFVSSEVIFQGKFASGMPVLLVICIATTLGLSSVRRSFPDETRGVRNYFLTLCGFAPPGIPTPATLQQSWSGGPISDLKPDCEFKTLNLGMIFTNDEEDEEDEGAESIGVAGER